MRALKKGSMISKKQSLKKSRNRNGLMLGETIKSQQMVLMISKRLLNHLKKSGMHFKTKNKRNKMLILMNMRKPPKNNHRLMKMTMDLMILKIRM